MSLMSPLPRLLARSICQSIRLPSPQYPSPPTAASIAAGDASSLPISLNNICCRHTYTHSLPQHSIRPARPFLLPSNYHQQISFPLSTIRYSSSSATSDPNSPTPPPPSSPLTNAISAQTQPPRLHTPLKVTNPRKDDDGKDMILNITPRAVDRLHHLMKSEPTTALRITVESGGCHGFQYFLSLINLESGPSSVDQEDTIFDQDGARVVIDESSLQLLKGSKVDYTMELIGRQFKVVDGPGMKSSCGCGTSFDVKI